ncbi:NAD-dependent succinate-semialdehyde dehydrogenase [Boseaceae bacterium BT-24-1]|nr:NAD-dependent succinate-semialdehyde dehydrogenase [Boseaceae bacterium BT-24-1]
MQGQATAIAQASADGYGGGELQLLVDGEWRAGCGRSFRVINPATGEVLAEPSGASLDDLDAALAGAEAGFALWRRTPATGRAVVLARTAQLLRDRTKAIARLMTIEQGKPLAQSELEISLCAETFDWYAAEAGRAYGRIIPARSPGARQMVLPEPIGPVAAFTPWNFPALLAARKVAPALAAGCSCILKPAEETPASALALGHALADAGLPAGVLNIVFGDPAEISRHLIASPVIRKITFTGSIPVGRSLAVLAAEQVKPCTLELGGHAPVIILDDADIDAAAALSAIGKTRNAGQVCTSPTRFYVQRQAHDRFVERFGQALSRIVLGDGLDPQTEMGPLANARRLDAMERLVTDAARHQAEIVTGGESGGERGFFWRPTLLANVPDHAAAMTEEPFGPLALVSAFDELDEAIARANRSSVGLAGYAFTRSASAAVKLGEELEVGVLGLNSFAVSHTEAPFSGVKQSGYGYEGGSEGLAGFLHQKYVHHS